VDHDDDVSAGCERKPVSGLLVAAIAEVLLMFVNFDSLQTTGDSDGLIAALVVNEDDFINDALVADFGVGLGQSLGGVIGGHHHDDFFIAIHGDKLPKGSGWEKKNPKGEGWERVACCVLRQVFAGRFEVLRFRNY
jgi:hypothetical protein